MSDQTLSKARRLIRKIHLLEYSIKKWKSEKNTEGDKSSFIMLKELKDI